MDSARNSQTPSGHQSSSSNTPQTATSTFKQLPSYPTSAPAQSISKPAPKPQKSKRSRARDVVTPNACTECRRKRAKCDGQKPCGRCRTQKDIECVYEIPAHESKENLRNNIESLRQRQRSSDLVFSALARSDFWEEVLKQLHGGQPIESISEWVGKALPAFAPRDSHTDTMSLTRDLRGPSSFQVASCSKFTQNNHGLPRYRGLEQLNPTLDEPDMKHLVETWTIITNDINLVHHLLALYFCWEYPTFASLSKEHFIRDFQDGRHRYCSSLLVNALLALGCSFSTQPITRADPGNSYSTGDHFFKESQRLFNQETDHHSLTTIQALGIMSIREASCGRDSESSYYASQSMQLSFEMGLHHIHDVDQDELAVQSATFWGAFSLDHAWSLMTGSLPRCSYFPYLPPKPMIMEDIEASPWVPYTDDGKLPTLDVPLQRKCEQSSNVRSVYKCFCELSELVHQSLYLLHSPGKPLTARSLLSIYTQYLNWYDRIPDVLRLGCNFTPAVLFAHMYYHMAILLLFRPLIKLRIMGSKVSPRDVCSRAAYAIKGHITSYSKLYTLKRTPSFMPYFVLTSSIIHLATGAVTVPTDRSGMTTKIDPHVSEAVKQDIADLAEMAPCHHSAKRALHILRYFAGKRKIDVDIDLVATLNQWEYDKAVRPCTRNLNFFASNLVADNFIPDLGMGKELVEDGTLHQVEKAAESMENPQFWPFPVQGRPMFRTGKELEEAGFAVL